jgi:hypothetical protein
MLKPKKYRTIFVLLLGASFLEAVFLWMAIPIIKSFEYQDLTEILFFWPLMLISITLLGLILYELVLFFQQLHHGWSISISSAVEDDRFLFHLLTILENFQGEIFFDTQKKLLVFSLHPPFLYHQTEKLFKAYSSLNRIF